MILEDELDALLDRCSNRFGLLGRSKPGAAVPRKRVKAAVLSPSEATWNAARYTFVMWEGPHANGRWTLKRAVKDFGGWDCDEGFPAPEVVVAALRVLTG